MMKKQGFTLAEVLITLGIIGVVAAMTIPTLISNTNGAQFKTAYKKALSTLSQAAIMNVALDDTDLSRIAADPNANGSAGLGLILKNRMQSATLVNDSYTALQTVPILTEAQNNDAAPTVVYTMACQNTGTAQAPVWAVPATFDEETMTGSCDDEGNIEITESMSTNLADYTKFSFADGTAFWYHKEAHGCTDALATQRKCYGFIDVNVATGPNQVISCADADNGRCDSAEITDIYPVIFHGQTFEPATASAKAVLFGK